MTRNRGKHKQPKIDPFVSDALRDHALLARWYEKRPGRAYLRGFSQYDGLLAETFQMMKLNAEYEFPDYMLHWLRAAETFAVQPDMHALVSALAQGETGNTIPKSMCVHELPAMEGFVRLPEPIWTRDVGETDYPIRAFAWYVDPRRTFAWMKPKPGTMPMVSIALFSDQWPGDPALKEANAEGKTIPGPPISLLHFAPFNLDDLHAAWSPASGMPKFATPDEQRAYQFPARYMVLFFLIANQKIASSRPYEPRQLGGITTMKAREAKIVPRVRVITLRRERIHTEPDPEGSGREYSHRWTVRAFWRHQACGPGNQERKWVLVRAHVRGPDDKPLIVKERAFDLRR